MATNLSAFYTLCAAGPADGTNRNFWGDLNTHESASGDLGSIFGDGTLYCEDRTSSGIVSANTWFQATLIYTNGQHIVNIWKGGVSQSITEMHTAALTTISTGTAYNFNIFRFGDYNTSLYWPGGLGELILYTQSLADPNRSNVEAYLKAKWGTP